MILYSMHADLHGVMIMILMDRSILCYDDDLLSFPSLYISSGNPHHFFLLFLGWMYTSELDFEPVPRPQPCAVCRYVRSAS
jgi:hypothetical protein